MDRQDVCSGYDDNSEAPIGCSIMKDVSEDMDVIRQWILSFQEG
jgi:hypothetical protein